VVNIFACCHTMSNTLDMGARSAIQTAIAIIIAPTKKKRQRSKKVNNNKKNKNKKRKPNLSLNNSTNNRIAILPDKANVKKIMDICVHSPSLCISAKELLFETVSINNSHVRLLIIQVIHHLFINLPNFRKAVAPDMRTLVLLCIGDKSITRGYLPPPAKFASFLKARFIDMFEDWHLNYGTEFKALRVAHTYMEEKCGAKFSNQNKNKRMKLNGNNGALLSSSSSSTCNMGNAWSNFHALRCDEINIEDIKDALQIVEEALNMLLINQEKHIADMRSNVGKEDIKTTKEAENTFNGEVYNSVGNEVDDDDDDDDWLDAETNMPLTDEKQTTTTFPTTTTTSINNKFSLLVQKMNEFKKILDNRHSKNITKWIKEINTILKALRFTDKRYLEVKEMLNELLGLRNRIDILNDRYELYKPI
jgi:hypothetical protein